MSPGRVYSFFCLNCATAVVKWLKAADNKGLAPVSDWLTRMTHMNSSSMGIIHHVAILFLNARVDELIAEFWNGFEMQSP